MNSLKHMRYSFRKLTVQNAPVFDFLVPAIAQYPPNRRYASTTSQQTSPPAPQIDAAPKRRQPLSKEQRDFLDSAVSPLPATHPSLSSIPSSHISLPLTHPSLQLRVNQAGELAATLIYTAQTPQLLRTHPHLRATMQHMYSQEAGHFAIFNALLSKHRIRPTAMYPIWSIAATALGWGTAMLGREAAMACTEAVETEIGGHYNGQVRVLLEWMRAMEQRGEEVGEELRGLVEELKKIRDEELEHLDTAVGEDAREAKGWPALNAVIRGGCRGAIWISERV
ncbi:MAG: hypothetical protein LQ343_005336 [Gyalolechia ehrenbergii]|nr:MAG: hypothetical protein LQ343_005336 [Gyalolechia ehrenbergii]